MRGPGPGHTVRQDAQGFSAVGGAPPLGWTARRVRGWDVPRRDDQTPRRSVFEELAQADAAVAVGVELDHCQPDLHRVTADRRGALGFFGL